MRGVCEHLCPPREAKLRTKEKLLHFYEFKNGEKHVPGILVKSFSRSAAGVRAPDAKDLRTEKCLKRTIEYLLGDVIMDARKSFNFVYDFIFDRLRAVRQELVIQNFNGVQLISMLEPIIMFLAYSRYRLCEETINNFDPKICEQHLQECLKRILIAYDELPININEEPARFKKRVFIEALYQVHNLGSMDALTRCLQLPKEIKTSKIFSAVLTMAIDYHQGNLYRVIRSINTFPHLICALASLHMQSLRRKIYETFSHAYNSKQLNVPVEWICNIVQQNRVDVLLDCGYYNLKLIDDRHAIQFLKTEFQSALTVLPAKHESFVERKLKQISLPDVLLLNKIA